MLLGLGCKSHFTFPQRLQPRKHSAIRWRALKNCGVFFVAISFYRYHQNMSLLDRFRIKSAKTKTIDSTVVGGFMPSLYQTMGFYHKFGSYDNTFPNISRIAEAFAEVMPYAIDATGQKMAVQPAIISALYNPNKEMSGFEFFETLAVLALVHPKVYILCWRNERGKAVPGGPITPDNIAGFTFLENPKVEFKDTGKTYTIRNRSLGREETYSENEVIEIPLNVNPYSVLDGYSPSMASKKWSNTDDYIADYQAGFFKNGAVPAGQFIITAKDVDSYNEIVAQMQLAHRGPEANNNVQYVHRPLNSLTNEPMPSQIEWIPFQQANNQMALQQLFDQANKKIDMAFGVPQEVKGYVQNSNYASVEVADYIFARRVVYPKLMKIWAKFTHEMNRITGGLGCAISFDYEVPVLQDTRKVQVENLLNVLDKGYTLESAVEALQLPKSFLKLATPEEAKPTEEEPTIQEIDTKETATQTATSNRKTVSELKKKLIEENPAVLIEVENYTREQINYAIEDKKFNNKTQSKKFAKRLLLILLLLLDENAEKQYADGKEQVARAGYDITNLPEYETPQEVKDDYETYLNDVALSYTDDTSDSIKAVLKQGKDEGWDTQTLKDNLAMVMETDRWRINRLARTETHKAEQMGTITAMRQLQEQTGATIYKTWHVNPLTENHCETCESLDGVQLPLDGDFGFFNAGDGNVADAHPNCSCYLTFEVVENTENV